MIYIFKYFFIWTIVCTYTVLYRPTFVSKTQMSSNKCKNGWKLHKIEPHWNKYYRNIIYSISFINYFSDFIVQTAPVWVKISKIKHLPYPPLDVGPSTIIVKWVGSTTPTVSGKKMLRSDKQLSFVGPVV